MKDLETENLIIRKFKLEDAEDAYKNLASEERLSECLGYRIHENVEETRMMIRSYMNEYDMNELVWAIEEKKTRTVVGYINALEYSKVNKLCNIKFGLALDLISEGLMEEALNKVLEYLFDNEGFEIITTEFYDGCKEFTKIKSEILENVGMKKEAVLRNRKINEKTKKPESEIVYSILKEEFKNTKK